MKKSKRILLIGDDRGYWQALEQRFKQNYQHVDLEFIHSPIFNEDLVNTKIVEVMEQAPDFIYIDLTKSTKVMFQLALYLKRIDSLAVIPLIGLVDNEKHAEETLLYDFDFVFIKGGELHDVIYHPYVLRYPKEALKKDFALAKFKDQSKLTEVFRVGYFGENSLHIEGDCHFEAGDQVKLKTNISDDYNKSDVFLVRKRGTKDLYYNYKYNYDLELNFIDELILSNTALDDAMMIDDKETREKEMKKARLEMDQKKNDHEDKLKRLKKKYKDWVLYNKDAKVAKKTKILLVDKEIDFLSHEQRKLDSFPYTVRIQTGFDEDFSNIVKYLPNLIVFQINDPNIDEGIELSESEHNEMVAKNESQMTELFGRLVQKVNSIEDYTPFIIIFNCKNYSSKAFQDTFKYALILTNPGPINFDIILQMAQIFEKKQDEKFEQHINNRILELRKEDPVKHGRLTMNDFIESRYYVSKSSPLSRAYYDHNIEMKAISESEVYFLCETELELRNYYLEKPFKMMVRLIAQDEKKFIKEGKSLQYKGLIHSIGEVEKKELRRYVNEIYTSHKSEERAKEEAAFKELNEKVKSEAETAQQEDEKAETDQKQGDDA